MINLSIHEKIVGDRLLFSNFRIRIKSGDFLVLTGVSGAGKSTLLNILGLLDLDFRGDYFFNNTRVNLEASGKASMIRKANFGYVFQNSLINDKQSVIRNLLCSLDHKEQKLAKKNIPDILNRVALSDVFSQASVLSGGEKQRLALARALIKKPSVLFADEPTASLDRDNKHKVMSILSDFNDNGGTVVMVTHDTQLITNKMNIFHIESFM